LQDLSPESVTKSAQQRILTWRDSPATFATETLGITLADWQAETLEALNTHDRLAIRSGHGVGKSTLMSVVILWWLCTRYPAKVACTAPTAHQLQDVLWAELGLWHRKLPDFLREQFRLTSERFSMVGHEETSFAVARSSNPDKPETFQGFHSENMLFLCDEASGIEDIIFEVGSGAMSTPGAKTVMVGNPNRPSGYFYEAFTKQRKHWWTKKVSCLDVEGTPYASASYPREMAEKYGLDSNVYRVRVLGEFPTEEDDVLIPLSLVEAAHDRDVAQVEIRPVWGLDVARFGNCRTALAKRRGNVLLEPIKSWRKRDLMEVSGLVLAEYEDTPSDERPVEILIDSVGLGAGVVDRCRELGLPVRGINVGETPSGRQRFNRLRDELWWKTREWFEARDCKIPNDETLIGQLTTLKYKFSSTAKIVVERKEDLQSRGVESPDEADSFVLTMAGLDVRGIPERYERKPKRRQSAWTR